MRTETDIPHGGPKPYANPYLAGVLLGLVLLASFVILGAGLGASGGIARIGASLSMCVSAPHTLGSEYFGKWGAKPLNYYLVFMFVGTFVGALFSALLANRVRIQVERGAASSVSRRLWLRPGGRRDRRLRQPPGPGLHLRPGAERRRAAAHRQPGVPGLSLCQRLCHGLVRQEAMA